MATAEEVKAGIARADAALTKIQADIVELKRIIDSGAGLDEIKAAVDALAARAEGIDAETPDVPPAG